MGWENPCLPVLSYEKQFAVQSISSLGSEICVVAEQTHSPILDRQHCYLGLFNKPWRKTGPLKSDPPTHLSYWINNSLAAPLFSDYQESWVMSSRVVIHQLNGKQEVTGIATSCLIWLLQFPISMWSVGTTMFSLACLMLTFLPISRKIQILVRGKSPKFLWGLGYWNLTRKLHTK